MHEPGCHCTPCLDERRFWEMALCAALPAWNTHDDTCVNPVHVHSACYWADQMLIEWRKRFTREIKEIQQPDAFKERLTS